MYIPNQSHRRYNPLLGEWVLVCPHRTQRPWEGQTDSVAKKENKIYDPQCYLCPGNRRASGQSNPQYSGIYYFLNDFSSLNQKEDNFSYNEESNGLFILAREEGCCEVLCFSHEHHLDLASMNIQQITAVIDTWKSRYIHYEKETWASYIQIFENRGAMVGASCRHPHCQLWIQESIPDLVKKEQKQQELFYQKYQENLLMHYCQEELKRQERIVIDNQYFCVVVPFWAVWPFETLLMPKIPLASLKNLNSEHMIDLAHTMKEIVNKYDKIFNVSFPYSMGIHQSPFTLSRLTNLLRSWQLHIHFYPPLLRSASVRKFMVGYELLAMPQRDIQAEKAAEILRQV